MNGAGGDGDCGERTTTNHLPISRQRSFVATSLPLTSTSPPSSSVSPLIPPWTSPFSATTLISAPLGCCIPARQHAVDCPDEAFGNITQLWTNNTGVYSLTAQEDNASFEAMIRADKAGLMDFSRVILMRRTASDFDRAPPDQGT